MNPGSNTVGGNKMTLKTAFLGLIILFLAVPGWTQIVNPGFESGDLTGWTSTGTAFNSSPTQEPLSPNWSGWEGQHYLNSWSTADTFEATGTLRSAPFRLTLGVVEFLISGWGSPVCYVTLNRAADGRELARVNAPNNEKLEFYHARLAAPRQVGSEVYLEIIDRGVTYNDWICADNFKEVPLAEEMEAMQTIDITGNWHDTAQFDPRIQTREAALTQGETRTFQQTLDLPTGDYDLLIDYDPNLDKETGLALGKKLTGFDGLSINGQAQTLDFTHANDQSPYSARCGFHAAEGNAATELKLVLHSTRAPRTRLHSAKPLLSDSPYLAVAPDGIGEPLSAHGLPFLTRHIQWFRSGLEKGTDHGSLQPWKEGMDFDCAGTPVKTAYFLGMIHNIDLGNGSWYSPKGDHGYSHFVGDQAGSIVITWTDDTQTTVPLVFGYNLWFSRPWDMIWHYNWAMVGPGRNRDSELFGGSEQDRDTIRNGLALADGIRLMGADSSNTRFVFALDLGGRAVKSLHVAGVPELHDFPLISAVTLESAGQVNQPPIQTPSPLVPLPQLSLEPTNIRPVTLDEITRETFRPAVDRLMHTLYTFVDDLPALEHPDIPEGYFGPDYDFQGVQDAVYAACYLYRNAPECAAHCPDSGVGCSSPTASGQLVQYMDGMGVWFRNPTFFKNITDWFYRYRTATPGQFPGANNGWTRGEAPLLREAAAFGYEKYTGTYTDWLDNSLMTLANPPHWGRVAGTNFASYEVKVGDITERGNRENDGHGLCMMARYMVWHWLGRPRGWNERHWKATEASAEWLQWQLDTDTIRPGVRKDVLFTESECAHGDYDIYSTWSCVHGLKLSIRLASQLGQKDCVDRWTKLYDRLRQGCLDHLVDQADSGPVWHTYPHNDWQDHAHKLIPVTLASDGDTFTPLDDSAAGDEIGRRCLEISRNSYRVLMKEKNYNCLRMYGYGQGYMTQAALILDEMGDAEQFLDLMLRYCYLPKFGGWTGPEGIIVHRSGKYYLPVNGYMGQDVHVGESTKALRLILGFDDNDPRHLRLVPRYPAAWTHLSIDKFPVLTGESRQLCAYTYDRKAGGQTFTFGLERPVEKISLRLGPIPAGTTVKSATFNGQATPYEQYHSGDSDWIWVRDLTGQAGTVEIRY